MSVKNDSPFCSVCRQALAINLASSKQNRTMNNLIKIITLFSLIISLASCEQDVTMETTVHADGRLDKIITFEQGDSPNMMGLDSSKGWKMKLVSLPPINDSVKGDVLIAYEKSFPSAEAANLELASTN